MKTLHLPAFRDQFGLFLGPILGFGVIFLHDFEARVSSLDGFGLQIWTGSSLIARHLLVLFLSRAPRAYSGWSSLFACSLQFSELISIFFGILDGSSKRDGYFQGLGQAPC